MTPREQAIGQLKQAQAKGAIRNFHSKVYYYPEYSMYPEEEREIWLITLHENTSRDTIHKLESYFHKLQWSTQLIESKPYHTLKVRIITSLK